jgi:hypothetical protein
VLLSADVVNGVLTVQGTGADEHIRLVAGAEMGQVRVEFNGVDDGTVYNGIESIRVLGHGGADTLEAAGEFLRAKNKAMAITLDGGDGDDTLKGSHGSDRFIGGAGIDTLDLSDATAKANVDLRSGKVNNDGYGSRDTVEGVEDIIGTAFSDHLCGDDRANRIDGGAGDDHIDGHGGDDTIHGGDGADKLHAGIGDDVVYGEDGNDHIWGEDGNDRLFGGAGDDKIWGGQGDDQLVGNGGVDQLTDPHGHNQLYPDEIPAPEPDPTPEPTPGADYIVESEPNDSSFFANAYVLTLGEPLYLSGDAWQGDRDFIRITTQGDGFLSLQVSSEGDDLVTAMVVNDTQTSLLLTARSDTLNSGHSVYLPAGTTVYLKVDSTSSEAVTYYIDLVQTSA